MEDVVIGRDAEQAQLLDALESPRSELTVVYGRRRIGKTYHIRNTYADAIRLEFAGMHRGTYKDQLKNSLSPREVSVIGTLCPTAILSLGNTQGL